MKTIYLVLHATADKGKPKSPDRKRVLSKKGKNEAVKMAKKIKKNGALPDLLISSPAKRAIQTARIFAEIFKYPKDRMVLNKTLFKAEGANNSDALLEEVRGIDDQYQSAMVFGHDPLLTELAHYLRKDFTEVLPGCGVVCFDFRNISWSKISKGRGILKFFDYPKREKERLDQVKGDLLAKITENLMQIFAEVHPDAAKNMKKSVEKSVGALTQRFVRESKGKN